MGVSLPTFRDAFPEFVRVSDEQVQVFLDLAEKSIAEDVWGRHVDEGHLFLTAHLLAQSPYGQNARLEGADGTTTYGVRYKELQTQVACGLRVV